MDKRTLVGDDLDAGKRILTALDARGIPVDVAAWLQDGDTGTWRLLLSSQAAETDGPKPLYQAVAAILGELRFSDIELDDVLVTGPRDNVVKDLKRLVRTGDEPQTIGLDDLELGGLSIRSMRVYRVRGPQRPDDRLEFDARVRVKSTGELGFVRGVFDTPSDKRYLVLYDRTSADPKPRNGMPIQPTGQDFAASELDFLYAVRPGGIPEKPPLLSRPT